MNGNGLFGSTILDVAIGLVFVYLLLALICTTMNEWIAALFKTRSATLALGIRQMLDGQKGDGDSGDVMWFLNQFYGHPLIQGLSQPRIAAVKSNPAYISSRAFATTVMDIAAKQKQGPISFADLELGIKNLPEGDVRRSLLALIQNAHGDLDEAQKNIEGWFDDTMDRVSGWYKRKTQLWTFLIAMSLAIGINADTLTIVRTLWRDPTVRAELVERAKHRTEEAQPARGDIAYQDNDPLKPTFLKKPEKDELSSLSSTFGWDKQNMPSNYLGWAERVTGWMLTIIAVSLGAPFWFDVLNKFMRVRNAGDAPNENPKAPEKTKRPPQDKAA